VKIDMELLRRACWDEFSLVMTYRDLEESRTRREIWPLGLSYGEGTLMLLAHCRLRLDYRIFHVARIEALERGRESFRPHRAGLLRDYAAARRRQLARP
jgi:predicted DNA-binding transcriptional regulator YafY